MISRPYVLLSVAESVDGYIDEAGETRLVLSNDADLDRIDEVRAGVDAILVGASTIRSDDPRLVIRSARRRAERTGRGLPPNPAKVTLTRQGGLKPTARFFTEGHSDKLVYAPDAAAEQLRAELGTLATVVGTGPSVDLNAVLADLAGRGIGRLMVEGGGHIHTQFLTAGLADELHLVIAPLFVGDPAAPRFVHPGKFPHDAAHRMTLTEVSQIGDVALLRYRLSGGSV